MARKKNENDYALQTIISKDAAEFLSKLAKEDDRSLVKYTKRIIMKHLEMHGYVEGNENNSSTQEAKHIDKEESQKKSNSTIAEKELKQSANCNNSSATNRTRGRNTKVAPVPMSFIK